MRVEMVFDESELEKAAEDNAYGEVSLFVDENDEPLAATGVYCETLS